MRDELQFLLRRVLELHPAELPRFLGDIEEIRCTAMARLVAPAAAERPEADRLLSVEEASLRLGVTKDYLYHHGREMPFTRRMGRKLLFSSLGMERFIDHQNGCQNGLTALRQRPRLIPVVNRTTKGSR